MILGVVVSEPEREIREYIAARQPDKKTPGRAGCEVSYDKEREGTVRAVRPRKTGISG